MGNLNTERKKRKVARQKAKAWMHDCIPACRARDKVLMLTPLFPREYKFFNPGIP